MKETLSRRNFFKRIAGTGVLIAASSLPTQAQDDPSVFPKRGRFERLSLCYGTIKIGLEHPFSILHISDSHLTAAYPTESEKKQKLHENRTQCFGGHQEEALSDALAWAKEHVDYVVHTGDLIDWQSEANFDLVRKYFGENIFGTMGNHEFSPDMWLSEPKEDGTEDFKDRTRGQLQAVYPFDTRFHAQVVNGVNFIGLDDVYGTVTAKQVEQFKNEAKRGLPMILCMHVPFYSDNIFRATNNFWASAPNLKFKGGDIKPSGNYKKQQDDAVTRDFISYLKQLPLLRGILCGHEHFSMQDKFSDTAEQFIVGGGFLFHAQEILFL